MKKVCSILVLLVLMVSTISTGFATQETYPNGPIKFIVPLAAGGAADAFVRTLAPYLGEELGTNIVVENVEGAGTQIGLTALLAATPDGYTVGSANQPHLSFTIAIQNASYAASDFAWVNMQQIDPLSLAVMKDQPWQNFQDLADDIKKNPGEIAIGVVQMGGSHVFLLYLQQEYDLDFIIVPYSGGGEGRAALIGGHVDVFLGTAFADYTLRDQVRSIAIGWDERNELWPEAATFEEATGDKALNETAKALASFRGILVPSKFKDDYPERFKAFVDACEKAYHLEGHLADAEKTGQSPIMYWIGPEESEKLSAGADDIVAQYAHYFGN